MKCWAWLILLALTAAPGCLMGPQVKQPSPPLEFKQAAPPPVLPEQVTEENAEASFTRLKDEIDRDTYAPPAARN